MDYRVYVPGVDEALVVGLRSHVWGENHPHTDTKFLQWMLHATPLGDGTGILMLKDGMTVGFMASAPGSSSITAMNTEPDIAWT